MRKKTSWMEIGSAACVAEEPDGPTSIRMGELTGPASKSRPATLTPSTSAIRMGTAPLSGMTVA